MCCSCTHAGLFNFTQGDFLQTFAKKHNISMRGHNLIWVAHNPPWLVSQAPGVSSAQLDSIMKEHIESVAAHYKGRVYSWDVVNEGIIDVPSPWFAHRCSNWTCALKNTTNIYSKGEAVDWTKAGDTSASYVEKAFRYAHAIDPTARLFYNVSFSS